MNVVWKDQKTMKAILNQYGRQLISGPQCCLDGPWPGWFRQQEIVRYWRVLTVGGGTPMGKYWPHIGVYEPDTRIDRKPPSIKSIRAMITIAKLGA